MNVSLHITVPGNVQEEVEHITSALPGKLFYATDGEVLILADRDEYIISVAPNSTEFNNGNPTTSSAYLIAEPLADIVPVPTAYAKDLDELEGWSTGWVC